MKKVEKPDRTDTL